MRAQATGMTALAAGNPALVLDDTLVLVAAGSLGLFGAQVDKLPFTNTFGHAANLEIIVGRHATP